MIAIGIALTLTFTFVLAWGMLTIDAPMLYSEPDAWYRAQCRALRRDAERAETLERVCVRARDYATASRFYARHVQALGELAALDERFTKRSKRSSSGAAQRHAPIVNLVNSSVPAFEAVMLAQSAARSIGIRLRPVSQALRHGYIRACNRAGLDHEITVTIDRMLQT